MKTDFFDLEKQALFAHITTEKAPLGILWRDSTGKIVRANREMARMLQYSQSELAGMNLTDIDAEYDAQMVYQSWLELREKGVRIFESTHKRKDGTLFPSSVMTVIFTFDEKEYSCTFIQDISERREGEQKLRRVLAELEETKQQLTRENRYLKEEIDQSCKLRQIIGNSNALKEVLLRIKQVAKTKATVLVLGETGTGKELIARDIHEASGRRTKGMIKINCATLPANLIESELFGHEKGAFTGAVSAKAGKFELADKGTLFLDEIGEMPLELQAKLLRVLQEGEIERLGSEQSKRVDVRIIAATNRDLKKLVEEGLFREDLYYRLNVFPIICPPLRHRKEDIPLLTQHFVKKFADEIGKDITHIPMGELEKLINYPWPGNLREFQNIIERSVITCGDGVFKLESWFNPDLEQPISPPGAIVSLEENERSHILRALEATNWRVSGEKGAARILQINAQTLTSRMKKLRIQRKVVESKS